MLPIGSVITVNDINVLIVGYTSAKKQGKAVYGYYVVPYPLGYIDVGKLLFVPRETKFALISNGYRTEDSDKLVHFLEQHFELAKRVPEQEYLAVLPKIKEAIDAARGEKK